MPYTVGLSKSETVKNKTENAFSPTLPEMLFDRKKNHKMLQNTNAKVVANEENLRQVETC